jgi:nucleoid DNA-binding protein
MAIPYENLKNSITTPPSWYARLKPYSIVGTAEIAQAVSDKAGVYSAELVEEIVTLYLDEVKAKLLEGQFVTMERYLSFKLTCKEKLSLSTSIPTTDNLEVAVVASAPFRDEIRDNAVLEALPVTEKVPNIQYVEDTGTGLTGYIADGGVLLMTGQYLEFDQTNSDEGVFTTNTLAETTARSTIVAWNKSRKVIATPVLDTTDQTQNENRIEIRTRYTTTGSLRTGRYSEYLRSKLVVTVIGDYPLECLNGETA